MQHQDYNGWTNRETWQINLWFGQEFIYPLIKEDGVSDAETLKDIIVDYILPEEGDGGSLNGYIKDVIIDAIGEVNWEEIFDHYESELELKNYNYDSKGNWIGNVSNENGWTP